MAQIRKNARIALGIVVAGTAGTAALLGPAPAANAGDVNWDAVARCESGGNWSIRTGNGYYGGLQFNRSTWTANGGGKYAGTADKATRAQQIRIAEKVRGGRGMSPWPTCGNRAGSTSHYKATHKSNRHQSSTHKSNTHKSNTREWVTHKPVTHRPVTHQPGVHRKVTAAEATGVTYVVLSGDSLSAIATEHAVNGGWWTLYQLNKVEIGRDPNLIRPGQQLAL